MRALGMLRAGVLGNDQGVIDAVLAAAERTDEKAWQLPLERRYRRQLDSDIADISNMGGENAGATTAALFLEEFVGHDMHVSCLLGAARELAVDRGSWSGTLIVVVFQPAEELGAGAQAMVEDGLFERFGQPDVVLGQHVAPLPAGSIGLRAGLAFAASDSLTITLHGRGAHGSRPEASVDPVVMAAATIMRLQTIVSRETAGTETAVVTIGCVHAGPKDNIIPDDAELRLNVRTVDPLVRERTLAAITRIATAEAEASGAPRPAEVIHTDHFPAVVNDHEAVSRVRDAFVDWLGPGRVDRSRRGHRQRGCRPARDRGQRAVRVLAARRGRPSTFRRALRPPRR